MRRCISVFCAKRQDRRAIVIIICKRFLSLTRLVGALFGLHNYITIIYRINFLTRGLINCNTTILFFMPLFLCFVLLLLW